MSPVNMGPRGDVVDELVDTSAWRYAVISVRSEPDRERLVIAYPEEETLRDLIAAPSIVALGYTSRADALKNIDRCVATKTSCKRLLKTASLQPMGRFVSSSRHFRFDGLGCRETVQGPVWVEQAASDRKACHRPRCRSLDCH